ncbi:hypothetical protein GCM10011512_05270 [Tersicoccus solisilvae]|uniref:Bacterial transcriptional activator domain-containing protein n=1 Tax=Tersicoccus solisilvae TaxID=1882339 RepID=A0ABQ1NNJ0_9MICC|nr:hypothetical protein [Tersicoccus solisilvae]GGC81513.1 hypothetical protein GCM10011512_05270 [Tersicoccus solisilvae]
MPGQLTHGGDVATPDSAWRTRKDAWEYLGYLLTEQLHHRATGTAGRRTDAELDRLLGRLSGLEPYWAVPGTQRVAAIAQLVDAGRYRDALDHTETVADALRTPEYAGPDAAADADRASNPPAAVPAAIEVLVIDDGPTEDVERFRRSLVRQRRRADAFHYEVNVVSSADDAVVALLLNPTIQACVITPRFATRSERNLGTSLRAFAHRRVGSAMDAAPPAQRIVDLAAALGNLRPELDLYLVAGVALETLAGSLFAASVGSSPEPTRSTSMSRSSTASRRGTRRPSAPRCGSTANGREACSTPCPSLAGAPCTVLRGRTTWSTSTG